MEQTHVWSRIRPRYDQAVRAGGADNRNLLIHQDCRRSERRLPNRGQIDYRWAGREEPIAESDHTR